MNSSPELKHTDLEKFFYPRHIAIVGASASGTSFGGTSFITKLKEGGFSGKLYPINPRAKEIAGLKSYPDVRALPVVPDLAIISVSANHVPLILENCAEIRLRNIHILSAGFSETGLEAGRELEEQVKRIAIENNLLIIGPNCMGPYCPKARMTAWGAIPGLTGRVGIISQSGGLTQRLTEYMYHFGMGVCRAVSVGNAAVLGAMEFLEAMAEDDRIDVIAMYIESVTDGRRLLETVRQANMKKPVVLWKGGQSDAGAKTAASHTAAMAVNTRIWEAFNRQTGVVAVNSMNEWVDAIMVFSMLPAPAGKEVFIVGGGGGNSVSFSDICIEEGLTVPSLSHATMSQLGDRVPVAGSIAGNPLDMWQTFTDADMLKEILALANQDPVVSMIIVDRLIPRKVYHMSETMDPNTKVIRNIKNGDWGKPVVLVTDTEGGDTDLARKGAALKAEFCAAGIPVFPTIRRAARAFSHLFRYHDRRLKIEGSR